MTQFFEDGSYVATFDKLLPIPGVWEGMQVFKLPELMALHAKEEIFNYINHIYEIYTFILNNRQELMPMVDYESVRNIRGRIPSMCHADFDYLDIEFRSRRLLPAIQDQNTRDEIWEQLMKVKTIIPSMYTMLQDMYYLEPLSSAMKGLLGNAKPSVDQALGKIFVGDPMAGNQVVIQMSERTFQLYPGSHTDQKRMGVFQLWLFAARSFPDLVPKCPRKDNKAALPIPRKPSPSTWSQFARLALDLGFTSPKIRKLAEVSPEIEFTSPPTGPRLLVRGDGESLKRRCGHAFFAFGKMQLPEVNGLGSSYVPRHIKVCTEPVVTQVQEGSHTPRKDDINTLGELQGLRQKLELAGEKERNMAAQLAEKERIQQEANAKVAMQTVALQSAQAKVASQAIELEKVKNQEEERSNQKNDHITKTTQRLTRAEGEVSALKVEIENLRKINQTHTEQKALVEEQLAQQRQRVREMETARELDDGGVSDILDADQELRGNNDTAELHDTVRNLTNSINRYEAENSELRHRVGEQAQSLETRNSQLADLQNTLAIVNREKEAFRQQNATLESKSAKLNEIVLSKAQELLKEKESLASGLKDLKNTIRHCQSRINTLTGKENEQQQLLFDLNLVQTTITEMTKEQGCRPINMASVRNGCFEMKHMYRLLDRVHSHDAGVQTFSEGGRVATINKSNAEADLKLAKPIIESLVTTERQMVNKSNAETDLKLARSVIDSVVTTERRVIHYTIVDGKSTVFDKKQTKDETVRELLKYIRKEYFLFDANDQGLTPEGAFITGAVVVRKNVSTQPDPTTTQEVSDQSESEPRKIKTLKKK
ncbi:uncharacterized protein TRUGW13939_09734 [Talaromyces rugulosus]|uniref:Uncharacterized protein n=1 Tax=Talaromyces rugulosus TaxID=121627 RepID=A0A7H8RDD9_TALRU|nr:uncharacterized protein TRUGW13939_09734 [Talaromyces rugulosus]QKX62573.1 hypothetical protein TRUGW13939_09734 [Talaromyces rugulosus]